MEIGKSDKVEPEFMNLCSLSIIIIKMIIMIIIIIIITTTTSFPNALGA